MPFTIQLHEKRSDIGLIQNSALTLIPLAIWVHSAPVLNGELRRAQ
jgi:hypothetical protein